MKVMKFGGTSVGSVESILSLKHIVEAQTEPVIIVVSALGGITDKLIATSRMALAGDDQWRQEFDAMRQRHHDMVQEVISDSDCRRELLEKIDPLFEELHSIYYGVFLIHDLSPKTEAAIVSYGERLSSHIVATLINGGVRCNARDFIRTVRKQGKHVLDAELTYSLVREKLAAPSCVPSVASDHRSSASPEGDTKDPAHKTIEAPSGAVGGAIFRYPSYVQDIMGPLFFDYGFGPFRWVCSSGNPKDLAVTDRLAAEVLEDMLRTAPADLHGQLADNLHWIREASRNNLVVGSQARILYADAEGRTRIALAFNDAIRRGEITRPVVLGRDHHDVSGTDSPFRETSNIYDGSQFCADMAVQNVIGDSFRGATWVSLHNGGGVGWGEVINGGFGMVIDGSEACDRRIRQMLFWDVNNGIARRSWARNSGSMDAIRREMERTPQLCVTLPNLVDDELLNSL